MKLAWFAGVDWGSEKHQVCVLDAAGKVLGEREFEHSGTGLSQMASWVLSLATGDAGEVGVAVETPRGPVVESLMERGFAVHSINPKQLDRFRDRLSPAGAKDDRPDARVLASALRTDPHFPHSVGQANAFTRQFLAQTRPLAQLDDCLPLGPCRRPTRSGQLHDKYRSLRARGHGHARALRSVADRLLNVACAMLRNGACFDPHRVEITAT